MLLRPLHSRGHGVVREKVHPTCEPMHTLCVLGYRLEVASLSCYREKALMKAVSLLLLGRRDELGTMTQASCKQAKVQT